MIKVEGELWKSIPEFEGYYEVSNFGRVRGIDRVLQRPEHHTQTTFIAKGKIIKQSNLFGYKICSLYKDGKGKTFRIHRLVAMLFCSDYFDGCEVHHKDENRQNNKADNLVCMSKLEHLQLHGNGMKKVKKVDKLGNETFYDGVRLAAKENGVSHQSIVAVLKGKKPSCVGCKWYYVE